MRFPKLQGASWTGRVPGTAKWARGFARGVGAVQFLFFASLATQLGGLMGSRGILPARDVWRSLVESEGWWGAFAALPGWHSLLGVSDGALYGVLALGLLSSLALLLGVFEGIASFVSWSAVVTLCSLGTMFLRFQWDALLMECSFLTVLLVLANPPRLRSSRAWPSRESKDVPRVLFWVFLGLAVRLWFGSGWVKVVGGDPVWRNLTALAFHFETQPLPTPLAPLAHRAMQGGSGFFAKFTAGGTVALELLLPWVLLVSSARMRQGSQSAKWLSLWGVGKLVGLQLVIALTGNYAFFNLLTVLLTVWFAVGAGDGAGGFAGEGARRDWRAGPRGTIVNVCAATLLLLGAAQLLEQASQGRLSVLREWRTRASDFGLVHSYGLFARMTVERDELVLQASQDGRDWRDYEFKFKPGDPQRRLGWVAPHQPRLDWQAWFAALEAPRTDSWWRLLTLRLLAAEPSVVQLFEKAPFGSEVPRYVRTLRYRYRFDGSGSGIWTRELRGVYLPEMTLLPP